eukprot:scaffold120555_cov28-Tisochrysis_lutea.AAC.5
MPAKYEEATNLSYVCNRSSSLISSAVILSTSGSTWTSPCSSASASIASAAITRFSFERNSSESGEPGATYLAYSARARAVASGPMGITRNSSISLYAWNQGNFSGRSCRR